MRLNLVDGHGYRPGRAADLERQIRTVKNRTFRISRQGDGVGMDGR